jgi:hypothetical protein
MKLRTPLLLVLLALLTTACTGLQPFPNYARTGDTVSFALGREDAQVLAPMLKKEELTATITDAAGTTHTAKMRHVFKLYADPTSEYNVRESWFEAYNVLWVGVVDLVNPLNDNPLALASGPATMSITGNGLATTTGGYGGGDLTDVPVEILPGTGAPHPLNETDGMFFGTIYPVANVEPMAQVDVSPTAPPTVVGGAELEFAYTYSGAYGIAKPKVVPISQDPNVHLSTRFTQQPDGSYLIKCVLVSPLGFSPDNSSRGERPLLRDLSIRIVFLNKDVTDQNWQQALQLVSGRYVDLNGDTIAGVSPVLTKLR